MNNKWVFFEAICNFQGSRLILMDVAVLLPKIVCQEVKRLWKGAYKMWFLCQQMISQAVWMFLVLPESVFGLPDFSRRLAAQRSWVILMFWIAFILTDFCTDRNTSGYGMVTITDVQSKLNCLHSRRAKSKNIELS